MSFTPEEKRRWLAEKRQREAEAPLGAASPVAVCIHCQRPFGINQGVITPDAALCDVCNGD